MEMTVELFDSIINTSQDCVFWKDKERRFLGVNQAFLDFYGFDSQDVLLGKTDEEMGWHSDPEPYRHDELRVLKGKSTYKVRGKCMIRGEERDIIASKRPLYENGQIVGLVGSFVDVTDVLRRNENSDHHVVYTIDRLRHFDFFDRVVDEISLDEILDPLTGILSRAYSVKFINSLMAEKRPFTFTMLDLDNFKGINDRFGHSAGDLVLTRVAKGLADYVGESGLVGRFGGDELLMINLKDTDSESKKRFFKGLYSDSGVLRTSMDFGNGSAIITVTSGCATFPEDADSYDTLFELIDNMLYLGKSRGRNCYAIYDRNEHEGIEVSDVARRGVFADMHEIKTIMEKTAPEDEKLFSVMPLLTEILKIKDLYYVYKKDPMRAVIDRSFYADVPDIEALMTEDMISESSLENIEKVSPVFASVLREHGLGSVLISRVRSRDDIFGYLICAAPRAHRIWQDYECAILYYVAELLTA